MLRKFLVCLLLIASTASAHNPLNTSVGDLIAQSPRDYPFIKDGCAMGYNAAAKRLFCGYTLLDDRTLGVLKQIHGGTGSSSAFTPGSIIFQGASGFSENNARFFWDNTVFQQFIGSNNTMPDGWAETNGQGLLVIPRSNVTDAAGVIRLFDFEEGNTTNQFSMLAANGDADTTTMTIDGQTLGSLNWYVNYAGSGWRSTADITCYATQDATSLTNGGTECAITVAQNSEINNTSVMEFGGTQNGVRFPDGVTVTCTDCITDTNVATVALGAGTSGFYALGDSEGGDATGIRELSDCSAITTESECCWDTDDNTLCCGTGVLCRIIGGKRTVPMYVPLRPDGTLCTVNEESINSGEILPWATCANDNAATLGYGMLMPEGWNGSTVKIRAMALSVNATPSGVLAFNCSCECDGDGDEHGATDTSAPQNLDFTFTTLNDMRVVKTAAITCEGACTAGNYVAVKCTVDAGATTAVVADARFNADVVMLYETIGTEE